MGLFRRLSDWFHSAQGTYEDECEAAEMHDLIWSAEPDADKLDVMWQQQTDFMDLLVEKRGFPQWPLDLSRKESQQFVRGISHDCMHELFEAVHLLKNAKAHRQTEIAEFDRDAFVEELADAQHFLYEILLLSDVSLAEFHEVYMRKGATNVRRIEGGY